MPVIFFHTGWMRYYRGQTEDDPLIHNFNNNCDGEQYNFLPCGDGHVYGYARIARGINFERRFGSERNAQVIEGITVIFFARNPEDEQAYIVGWYRNATLYRQQAHANIDGIYHEYCCFTDIRDMHFVPVEQRRFIIPHCAEQKGGYARIIWYGDNIEGFIDNVLQYIEEVEDGENANAPDNGEHNGATTARWQQNQERKERIERVAVDRTCRLFRDLGYEVESVEEENCGWDITATKGEEELLIEVKGTSAQDIRIQLTPNEYAKLRRSHERYRVSVVTGCLGEPNVHMFAIRENNGVFEGYDDNNGNVLTFEERTAAIGTVRG